MRYWRTRFAEGPTYRALFTLVPQSGYQFEQEKSREFRNIDDRRAFVLVGRGCLERTLASVVFELCIQTLVVVDTMRPWE